MPRWSGLVRRIKQKFWVLDLRAFDSAGDLGVVLTV
jgi:hypothetical protein